MSWQHQSSMMWLQDFLPRDVEKIRVLTYGYPAKLVGSVSHAHLHDYTNAFLRELQSLRSKSNVSVSTHRAVAD